MKKFLKDYLFMICVLIFIVLLFKENIKFKNCIINGCILFFEQVFPTLFPMFIIQDLLFHTHFFSIIHKLFYPFFQKIFHMSSNATYIFLMSMISGTPTNAYLAANLVKEKKLLPHDASIILSYSCFLNPLFLYTTLNQIFQDSHLSIKLILVNYSINFIIAFLNRNYPYQESTFYVNKKNVNFTQVLANSIQKSFQTLLLILGTIIFYLLLCEGMNTFIENPLLNCLFNGILEATGGLLKIEALSISFFLKKVLVSLFISFGGLSIHTQIKNIIQDVSISYKPFLKARILQAILATCACIILT